MTAFPQYREDVTVGLVDYAGSDARICQAARVSTIGADSLHTGETAGLINFLMNGRHGSPFEHSMLTFFIEAPIFVFREFHRHRIGWSYNETSGRYKELEGVFYLPGPKRNLVQVGKPGAYDFVPGSEGQYAITVQAIRRANSTAWTEYQRLLGSGIAKEVARLVLPVNTFTSMYATCNPRSLMAFLSLRTKNENAKFPSYPQREIEMVAEKMEDAFAAYFPTTWSAFVANGRVSP